MIIDPQGDVRHRRDGQRGGAVGGGDHRVLVVNTDYSEFDQYVNVTRALRDSDPFKDFIRENTKPVYDSIRPTYNNYGSMKSAQHQKFEDSTAPFMRAAGATESEIWCARTFMYTYDIVGPGEFGEQVLLAASPRAAKTQAKFNQGAFKAEQQINARIDGATLTQQCLMRSTTKIAGGSQNKHVPGTNEYKQKLRNAELEGKGRYPSILTHSDPQRILDRFSGTGFYPRPQKEVVDIGELMGFWQDTEGDIGPVGHFYPTTRGTIHYNESGGGHIIPSRPNPFR